MTPAPPRGDKSASCDTCSAMTHTVASKGGGGGRYRGRFREGGSLPRSLKIGLRVGWVGISLIPNLQKKCFFFGIFLKEKNKKSFSIQFNRLLVVTEEKRRHTLLQRIPGPL